MSIKEVAIILHEWRYYGTKGHFYNEQEGITAVRNCEASTERRAETGRSGRIFKVESPAYEPNRNSGKGRRRTRSNSPVKG